jgi:hypothetical protein
MDTVKVQGVLAPEDVRLSIPADFNLRPVVCCW